jgi:D-alanyl-D-alanine dipeptidase
MISLSDPVIRAVKLVETYERVIDLGAFDEPLLVDRTRSAISNRSEHFLKVRLGVAQRLAFAARTLPQNLRFPLKEAYRPLSLQRTYFERHFAKLRDELPSASKARLVHREPHTIYGPVEERVVGIGPYERASE